MLDDQIVEPTDYNRLDKALQGGFRQGEIFALLGPRQARPIPRMLSEVHGWPPESPRCDFISLIQGVDSDDFPS